MIERWAPSPEDPQTLESPQRNEEYLTGATQTRSIHGRSSKASFIDFTAPAMFSSVKQCV